jgi:hypothetical protein
MLAIWKLFSRDDRQTILGTDTNMEHQSSFHDNITATVVPQTEERGALKDSYTNKYELLLLEGKQKGPKIHKL